MALNKIICLLTSAHPHTIAIIYVYPPTPYSFTAKVTSLAVTAGITNL